MKLTSSQWFVVIILSLLTICLILGCEGNEEKDKRRANAWLNNNKQRVSSILYVYDPRVDICYAVFRLGHREGTMTTVPYEKVKKHAFVIEYEGMTEEDWEKNRQSEKILH